MSIQQPSRARRVYAGLGRRGMLAACVGAAAAIADRFGHPHTALATDNQPLVVAQTNFSTIQTTLAKTSGAGVAMYVLDTVGGATNTAIRGEASGAGTGVTGISTSGVGIQASCQSGPGAVLDSNTSVGFQGRSVSGVGVIGSTNGTVVLAQGQAPLNAFAGQFLGGHGVFIDGDLQVTGQKSAAVPGKDGDLRRVFCMESPEAHFEDFGAADLVNGSTTVRLDKEFNDLVDGNRYHVFLTPYGDCNGLFVSRRGPNAFDVQELSGGKSSLRFAYRIVAPRGDGPKQRLPRTKRPDRPRTPPARFGDDDVRRNVRLP